MKSFVVDLRDPEAVDPALTGGKAAALARAANCGIATLPGAVLSTEFSNAIDAGEEVAVHPAVREAFERVGGGNTDLVARSSSVVEDTSESSMAGQFDSVIGIRGYEAFAVAVEKVLASRERAGATDSPIAVLVQPLIEPTYGGVLFGIDPVSGRTDRRVVTAVRGGPEPLVSGEVNGSRYVLTNDAKVVDFEPNDGPRLDRGALSRLVTLSRQVGRVFGSPQDVEWAIASDGTLWLLQSRPVTTEERGIPRGPIYGPGPVAETFPEPLTEFEIDLWVPPLRDAVREAVLLAGAASKSDTDGSQVVITIDGQVAIDLRLAGEIVPKRSVARALNPIPAFHRLRGAWRVGRLRSALPKLSERLLDRVDSDLEDVPALDDLTSRQLIALLYRGGTILRALHAHEILMGMLTDTGRNRMTGASVALRVLVEARQDGLTDEEVLARSPIVLALAPPRVAPAPTLPQEAAAIHLGGDERSGNDNGIIREALRLRVRWIQELTGRAAWELGERLAASGQLTEPELIRHMTLEHVEAVATNRAVVIPHLVQSHDHNDLGAPLPARFQLSDRGRVVRVDHAPDEMGGGTAAGGGIGIGPVTYDGNDPPQGSVLVTTTLTPGLGPLLSRLNGIVAETGSVLSHLAILAREAGVATVVGYTRATEELVEGAVVTVNGETGQVTIEGKETTP
jgi:pyruvate,water dikinase